MSRACLVLAMLETYARLGRLGPELGTLDPRRAASADLLALPERAWVDDLRSMSWAAHAAPGDWWGVSALLNPIFDGSVDVGGADADLIVDGCLFELKATTDPRTAHPEWMDRLLGDLLLDLTDRYRYRTRAVGSYLARQARLVTWPVADGLAHLAHLAGRPVDLARARDDLRTSVAPAWSPSPTEQIMPDPI